MSTSADASGTNRPYRFVSLSGMSAAAGSLVRRISASPAAEDHGRMFRPRRPMRRQRMPGPALLRFSGHSSGSPGGFPCPHGLCRTFDCVDALSEEYLSRHPSPDAGTFFILYRVGSVLTAAPSHTAQPSSEKAIGRAVQHPAVSELRRRALAILMMTLESCTTGPPLSSSAHRHRCLSGLWTHSLTLRLPASPSG